ncbi:hypothetical protein BRD00_07975 [Halobacteriales archaeon QS_8_69_26]|nr:MAG: hypothetical protein BRD00_07975 [Halobacteriales archaeon QS_8_69_26]
MGDGPRLGIVTGHRAPDLSEGGKRVAAALSDRGFRVDPVLWTDESVEWSEYAAALVRSCWDYHADVERFRALIGELERADVAVCNPLAAIR